MEFNHINGASSSSYRQCVRVEMAGIIRLNGVDKFVGPASARNKRWEKLCDELGRDPLSHVLSKDSPPTRFAQGITEYGRDIW